MIPEKPDINIIDDVKEGPRERPMMTEIAIDGYMCPMCGNMMHWVDDRIIACYNAECVIYLRKFVRPVMAAPLMPIEEGSPGGKPQ